MVGFRVKFNCCYESAVGIRWRKKMGGLGHGWTARIRSNKAKRWGERPDTFLRAHKISYAGSDTPSFSKRRAHRRCERMATVMSAYGFCTGVCKWYEMEYASFCLGYAEKVKDAFAHQPEIPPYLRVFNVKYTSHRRSVHVDRVEGVKSVKSQNSMCLILGNPAILKSYFS